MRLEICNGVLSYMETGYGWVVEVFLNLYNLYEKKGVMVAYLWDSSMGEGAWNLTFYRPLNDWDLDEAQNLLCFLN